VKADPQKPENFPDCTKYMLVSGIEVCGYTNLDDWKKVLDADKELSATRKLLKLERAAKGELESQLGFLKGQIAAYEIIVAEQDRRNDALTKDLLETDRKYQLERVKPKWGNPVAWTTAAVAAAVLGGFLLNDAL
jgi:hypothetical protein